MKQISQEAARQLLKTARFIVADMDEGVIDHLEWRKLLRDAIQEVSK